MNQSSHWWSHTASPQYIFTCSEYQALAFIQLVKFFFISVDVLINGY